MEPPRILVVDDDARARRAIFRVLGREGYAIEGAASAPEAINLLSSNDYNLVLTDIRMDRMTGIELLRRVKRQWSEIPVVVMTAFAQVDTVVSSINEGAFDYVSKPYEIDALRAVVRRAIDHARNQQEARPDVAPSQIDDTDLEMIGTSPEMVGVYKKIALVARTDATVLIEGETGCGKELVARAIHRNSGRRSQPFVATNCGALTESLLESELFGHVKGSFTGASANKRGLFESASPGTVFLDEIGETSPAMQTRLLRVLEEREIIPVGSVERKRVDIRVIAASNRSLPELVEEGRFRKDLFYRLNVVNIHVPPLRARMSDLPLLFDAFLKKYRSQSSNPMAVQPEVLDMLAAYHWPGNVRELENAVERAVALNSTGVLTPSDFTDELKRHRRPSAIFPGKLVPLEEIEQQYVDHVVSQLNGNMSRAAEVLGIDRRTLYRMIERRQGEAPRDGEGPGLGAEHPAGC